MKNIENKIIKLENIIKKITSWKIKLKNPEVIEHLKYKLNTYEYILYNEIINYENI